MGPQTPRRDIAKPRRVCIAGIGGRRLEGYERGQAAAWRGEPGFGQRADRRATVAAARSCSRARTESRSISDATATRAVWSRPGGRRGRPGQHVIAQSHSRSIPLWKPASQTVPVEGQRIMDGFIHSSGRQLRLGNVRAKRGFLGQRRQPGCTDEFFQVGRFLRTDLARFPHQPREVRLPVVARVAADDALHGCVRFQRRRIDRRGYGGDFWLARAICPARRTFSMAFTSYTQPPQMPPLAC